MKKIYLLIKQMIKSSILKKEFKILIIAILSGLSASLSAQSDAIEGKWFAEEMDNSTIVISEKKEAFFGKVIESDNAEHLEKNILKNFVYDPAENHWKGKIFSPKKNMIIQATITMIDRSKLKIVGKKLFFTKTMYFTRIETR